MTFFLSLLTLETERWCFVSNQTYIKVSNLVFYAQSLNKRNKVNKNSLQKVNILLYVHRSEDTRDGKKHSSTHLTRGGVGGLVQKTKRKTTRRNKDTYRYLLPASQSRDQRHTWGLAVGLNNFVKLVLHGDRTKACEEATLPPPATAATTRPWGTPMSQPREKLTQNPPRASR